MQLKTEESPRKGIIEHYRDFLPVSSYTPIVTLYEGFTPLIRSSNIRKVLGIGLNLYFKPKFCNSIFK